MKSFRLIPSCPLSAPLSRPCTLASRIVSTSLIMMLPSAGAEDDHALIARVAADRPDAQRVAARYAAWDRAVSATPVQAEDDLETLRIESAVTLARLKTRLARLALQRDRLEEAAQHAEAALELLREAPRNESIDVLELQAEGILAIATRGGRAVNAAAARRGSRLNVAPEPGPVLVAGSDSFEARHTKQRCSEEPMQVDEGQRILAAALERLDGDAWIRYPPDWPERSRRRAQYRGGLLHRGPTRQDAEGREWFIGVYDIRDLGYVPPDDDRQYLDPFASLQAALDRDALRNQSMLFRGWPQDLAAGLPLLRFFGGSDDFRGYDSPERRAEAVRVLRAYMHETGLNGPATRLEWIGR